VPTLGSGPFTAIAGATKQTARLAMTDSVIVATTSGGIKVWDVPRAHWLEVRHELDASSKWEYTMVMDVRFNLADKTPSVCLSCVRQCCRQNGFVFLVRTVAIISPISCRFPTARITTLSYSSAV
jgi:hypothetical protein